MGYLALAYGLMATGIFLLFLGVFTGTASGLSIWPGLTLLLIGASGGYLANRMLARGSNEPTA